jgi:hypothetical protein
MALKDDLRQIARMVRTGLDEHGDAERLAHEISDRLDNAKAHYPEAPDLNAVVEDVDQLKLRTLEAEFHYQNGHYESAAETLAPIWNLLAPRLEYRPFQSQTDPALLRQKLWALLHYVFYKHYAHEGHPLVAVAAFKRINEVILAELKRPSYNPSGTLAICNYFLKQGYRANRDFSQAELHFLEAQKHIQDRIIRRLNDAADGKDIDIESEIAYKDVFSARVISGLSWIALQEGHLTRSEHLLRSAETILIHRHHHQESLKLFLEVLRLVSMLRRAPFDSEAHSTALNQLAHYFERCKAMDDVAGQFRCASELSRGYLDLAEFANDRSSRAFSLHDAQKWIKDLPHAGDTRSRIHYSLLASRVALLRDDPQTAHSNIDAAFTCAKDNSVMREHKAEITIALALYHEHLRQFDIAEIKLAEVLKDIHSQQGDTANGQHLRDPVLEGECYLLRARIALHRRKLDWVEEHLGNWDRFSHVVENYYLHHLAESIRADVKRQRTEQPPHAEVEYDFDLFEDNDPSQPVIVTITERLAAFEKWMWKSVIERHPDLNQKQKAAAYGVTRHQIETILKRLELPKGPKNIE